jgi:hypothetical protein
MDHEDWPELRLADWEPTYLTLHRWLQIVGKIRLAHTPWCNHWWHVPLYVSEAGLTTSPMYFGDELVTMTFDFRWHRLVVETSGARSMFLPLEPMSVADFYDRLLDVTVRLNLQTSVWPIPVEVPDRTPFSEDRHHATYDRAQVERLHRILISVDSVFRIFRGRFLGKCSPVHLFWGAFDLAVSRFSGRRNPTPPGDPVMGQAYSHEVISHGFWPGGDWPTAGRVEDAIFYAYAVPEPPGFRDARVWPKGAGYDTRLNEFVLPYEVVRSADHPDELLAQFLESTYLAGAQSGGWDVVELQDAGRPVAETPHPPT